MPSFEYKKLTLLQRRESDRVQVGDIFVIRSGKLQYVMLVMGHKKTSRRRSDGHTFVWMYHWAQPSLRTSPCNLRDNDGNASCAEAWLESARERGESVKYAGNIFEYAPLRLIEGAL